MDGMRSFCSFERSYASVDGKIERMRHLRRFAVPFAVSRSKAGFASSTMALFSRRAFKEARCFK